MTINWGGVEFSSPELMSFWDPPRRSAIYSIMKKPDPINKPDTYTILYFGESEDLSDRGFSTHHKRQCWINQAGSLANVHVGVHLMPGSTANERRQVESSLVNRYHPACND